MKLCGFCGARLDDDQLCTCEKSKKFRSFETDSNEIINKTSANINNELEDLESITIKTDNPNIEDNTKNSIENVNDIKFKDPVTTKNQSENKITKKPLISEKTKKVANDKVIQGSVVALETYDELKSTTKSFVKDPIYVAKNKSLSLVASISLLIIEALSFSFMIFILMGKLLKPINNYLNTGNPFGSGLQSFFIIALNIIMVFGLIFGFTKIFKHTTTTRALISHVAIASIPLSLSFIIIAILSLILASNVLFALTIFLLTFALVSSICLLVISLSNSIEKDLTRILIVALSHSISFSIMILIYGNLLLNYLNSLISSFSGLGI